MTKQEYKEYLKSDHWRKLKELYKKSELFNNKCCTCELPLNGKYHFHHQSYKRLYHERITDLIHVCPKCHYRIHKLLFHKGKKLNLWTATNFVRKKNGLKGINRKAIDVKYKAELKGYKGVMFNGKVRRMPIYEKARAY